MAEWAETQRMGAEPRAVLTYGWPDHLTGWTPLRDVVDDPAIVPDRRVLGDRLLALRADRGDGDPLRLASVDRLVRRRIGGFRPLQALVATLLHHDLEAWLAIDAFTWALLRGMKDLDLSVPVGDDPELPAEHRWSQRAATVREQVACYGRFEDDGEPFSLPDDAVTPAEHRAFRTVLLRPNTRDELRLLATLVLSGPSTLAEVAADLGLSWHLGPRVLAPFLGEPRRGIVERVDGGPGEPRWRIRSGAIPWALFALERRLGLALPSLLESA